MVGGDPSNKEQHDTGGFYVPTSEAGVDVVALNKMIEEVKELNAKIKFNMEKLINSTKQKQKTNCGGGG